MPTHRRWKRALLILFALAWSASCWNPPFPRELILQHIPTVAAVAALIAYDRRWGFSLSAFAAILAFLAFHLLGARWLYSNVPYDEWLHGLGLPDLSTAFDWKRNHYDRLVHVVYGLLLYAPAREVIDRFARPTAAWSRILAIACILTTSAIYELGEWGVALALSPDAAESYNGQQGDMWDAQKDMALALGGAMIAALLDIVWRRRWRDAAR